MDERQATPSVSVKAPQTRSLYPWRRSSTVTEGEVFGARLSESLTPNFANSLMLVNENLPSFSEPVFSANCALGQRTGHIGSNAG